MHSITITVVSYSLLKRFLLQFSEWRGRVLLLCLSATVSGLFCFNQTFAQGDPEATLVASDDPRFKVSDSKQELNWLPGERWDALTGRISFYHVDIDIPGNNDLPVRMAHIVRNLGARYALDIPRLTFSSYGGGVRWEKKDNDNVYKIFPGQRRCNDLRLADNYSVVVPGGSDPNPHYDTGTQYLRSGLQFHFGERTIHFFANRSGEYIDDVSASRFPVEASYISPDNWYITCSAGGVFKVHADSGRVYTLSRWVHPQGDKLLGRGDDLLRSTRVSVLATRIEDTKGNFVSYAYGRDPTSQVTNPKREYSKSRLEKISLYLYSK